MDTSPTAEAFRRFFAEILVTLDARPRRVVVKVYGAGLSVEFNRGNPVFVVGGERSPASFRSRWLPEHPVPLVFRTCGPTWVKFTPTSGNRVKVRLCGLAERVLRSLGMWR